MLPWLSFLGNSVKKIELIPTEPCYQDLPGDLPFLSDLGERKMQFQILSAPVVVSNTIGYSTAYVGMC